MDTEPVDTETIDPGVADVDTDTADVAPLRPVRSRMLPALIISALLGAMAGGAVVYLGLMKPSPPGAPGVSRSAPAAAPAPAAREKAAVAGSEWASALSNAKQDTAAGRFREAQEEYLSILLIEPAHEDAMRGLVRVVGLIAKGDRAVLRRQAEEYRRAIALGIETEEHYTAPAMEILARASLQAAGIRAMPVGAEAPPASSPEIRGTARPQATSRPAPNPPPAPPPARRAQPAPTPPPQRPRTPSAPAPSAPPQTTAPAAPSAVQPGSPSPASVNVNEPFVTVVIGPFGSSERASAVTGELTISGYAARVRRQGEGSYLITLGPYRKSEAERAAAFVKSRFGANVPVALSPTP